MEVALLQSATTLTFGLSMGIFERAGSREKHEKGLAYHGAKVVKKRVTSVIRRGRAIVRGEGRNFGGFDTWNTTTFRTFSGTR
jgi:hypothetical protein